MKDSTSNPAPLAPVNAEVKSVPFRNASGEPSKHTISMPRKNTAAGDPYAQPKPSRPNMLATGGARYGVRVNFQQSMAPEAGATQGNGRILPSSIKRSAVTFAEGMGDYN